MKFTASQELPPAATPRPMAAPAPVQNSFQRDQDSFQRWYDEGEALANTGSYDRALRCFEEASILAPARTEALVYQAVCLIHLGRPQRALAVADQVLAIDPSHPQGWLYRGVALHRLGRYRECYASYARVQTA